MDFYMFLFLLNHSSDVALSSGVHSYAVLQSLFSKEIVFSGLLGYSFQSHANRDAHKFISRNIY